MGREARANQTPVEAIAPFLLSVPITKVDKEKRLVSGIATAENVDKQGEIVDYETAKKFFTDPDLWPGNIREMHQAEAVGTAVEVECDDANKVISLTARVSKGAPNTWEKVLDGTLKMFSIGGSGKRVIEKIGDGAQTAKRVFLQQLFEVSLVDNGANPLAKFDIVKSVDGALVAVADDVIEPVEKAVAALDAVIEDVTKAKAADDKNKTASGKEGKEYAGTDGKSFPIAEPKDVANAARALGRTDQDKAKVKANIIRIAYKLGDTFVAKLPEPWKKKADQKDAAKAAGYVELEGTGDEIVVKCFRAEPVQKSGPEPYDIDGALQAISFVNRLMSTEYWDARCAAASGDGDAGTEKEQVAMLKTACDALLAFLQSEYEEQFTPDDSGVASVGAGPFDVLAVDNAVEMFVKSLALVQKAGARHSKKDQEMVQKVHDVSSSLGADCPAGGDAEKILTFVARPAIVEILKNAGYLPPASATLETEPTEAVKKIAADLDATKALLTESQATVAKQAETAAALEARMKRIEDQPAGGGPVRSAQAVDKALGAPGADDDSASTASVVKALQAVAEGSNDPIVKSAIAMQIVKISHTNTIALSPRR